MIFIPKRTFKLQPHVLDQNLRVIFIVLQILVLKGFKCVAPDLTHGSKFGANLLSSFFLLPRGKGAGSSDFHMGDFICSGSISLFYPQSLEAVEVANGFNAVYPVCIWIVSIWFWMVDEGDIVVNPLAGCCDASAI